MKVKKVLCILMALSCAAALTACGSTSGGSASGSAAGSSQASSGGTKEIVLSHVYAENHPTNTACKAFKQFVEEKTNGKLTVNIQANSVLGGDDEVLEMEAMGTVQMSIPSVASMETYNPAWSICNLPYLYTSADKMYAAMDGKLGDYLKSTLDKTEFVCAGFNSNSVRDFTNNVRPITKAADLKGIKLRVMNNNTYIKWVNALGANATPIGYNEVFTALQQGTVDGQENGPDMIYESAFYEAQKYLSVSEHVYDMNAVIVNRAFYEGLSADEKAVFDEGVKTYIVEQQRQTILDSCTDYINKLKDKGMQVNNLDDAAKDTFKQALTSVYADYEKSLGTQIWDLVRSYQ